MTPGFELPESWRTRLLTPALLVDLVRVRHNVRTVIKALDGDPDRWRPHVKTTKLAPIFAELAAAGVRSFKCATTREAARLLDTLAARGVRGDVLLAHPAVGPTLARLERIAEAYPDGRLSTLVEDADAAAAMPPGLGLFVDVNPGMNRTGIPADRIADIVAVARAAGDRLAGVHFYEGHLHGLHEAEGRAAARACYDRLSAVLAALVEAGCVVPEVVTSGTPAFRTASRDEHLVVPPGTRHRVSPGTVVLHDTRSDGELDGLDLLPAAVLLARVVSRPADDVVTCDAGSKSIAAEAGDPCAVVLGRPDLVALRPSEEHLPLRVEGGTVPARGETLRLVPRHVCPTVNLFEQVVLLDDGAAPRLVPVDARAHDVLVDDPIGPVAAPAAVAARP